MAVVLTCVLLLATSVLATLGAVVAESALGIRPSGIPTGGMTPVLLVANSVGLGLLIPCALAAAKLVGRPARYLHSVTGRFRWSLLWRASGVVGLVLGAWFIAGLLIDGIPELRVASYSWMLLVALMLVTPFQAAGEEYLTRGVINRAIATWVPWRRGGLIVGAVVSSLMFTALHNAGDVWLNLVYFLMGLVLCHVTWRTGGLEAAVALHTVNNMLSFVFVPFQDLDQVFARQSGAADWTVLIQLTFIGVAAVIIEVVARRRGVATTAPVAAAQTTAGGVTIVEG
ncbi:MAG: lysostaphin resistance A-like protein [Arachnia sp.]